jgi:hypothetical protein
LIFVAFISLAGVYVGLDFEVIEHSDEDGRASRAKKSVSKVNCPYHAASLTLGFFQLSYHLPHFI